LATAERRSLCVEPREIMTGSSRFRAPFATKSCQRYVARHAPPHVAAAAVSCYEYDGGGNLTKQTLAPEMPSTVCVGDRVVADFSHYSGHSFDAPREFVEPDVG
jgi:hypothetical protein